MMIQAPPTMRPEIDVSMMTRRDDLFFALCHAILDDQSLLEKIPNEAVVALLPHEADDSVIEVKMALGVNALSKGPSVYLKWLGLGERRIHSPSASTGKSAVLG